MAGVLRSASMALDGYSAGPGGDLSWLTPFVQPNPDADSERIGVLLTGVLGADIARRCPALGRLQEILVFIEPVLLGAGTRLLHVPGGTNVRLERRIVREQGHEATPWLDVVGRVRRRPACTAQPGLCLRWMDEHSLAGRCRAGTRPGRAIG